MKTTTNIERGDREYSIQRMTRLMQMDGYLMQTVRSTPHYNFWMYRKCI
jgi:hypothetical protein